MSARSVSLCSALLAILVIGAAAWAWHAGAFNADELFSFFRRHERDPAAPLVVALVYIVAGFALVPVMALIAVTGLAFGPVIGTLYALLGALASGVCAYAIGRSFGAPLLARWSGKRVHAIRARLKARGLLAVIVVRVVPAGPYALVNLVVGASGIRARDFVLGTLLGMAPGAAATVGLVHGVRAAWLVPSPYTVGAVLIAAAALALAGRFVRRAVSRRSDVGRSTNERDVSAPEQRR